MDKIEKKKPAKATKMKIAATALLLTVLAAAVIIFAVLSEKQPEQSAVSVRETTYGKLIDKNRDDVESLAVFLSDGTKWKISRIDEEMWVLASDGTAEYPVGNGWQNTLLDAVCVIDYLDVLADDFAPYAKNSADFGLDNPKVSAKVCYTDGTEAEIYLGNSTGLEDNSVFMLVKGDCRLFSIDRDKLTDLNRSANMFYHVTQPVIHKSRIDRLEISRAGGENILLTMDSGIDAPDAKDRWIVENPITYAADGTKVDNLLSNAETLRLGAYVGNVAEMTHDEKEKYGLASPRMVLRLHMAAGSIGNPDENGEYAVTDYGEESIAFTLGGDVSDVMDYVEYQGNVFMTNHFIMSVFLDADANSLLSRYPVVVALDTLKTLEIEKEDSSATYTLERTFSENEDGEQAKQFTLTKNGVTANYAEFENMYTNSALATVSGPVPEGWQPSSQPHTRCIFTNTRGETHTLELTDFDPLHDAVTVDGSTVFYIAKGCLNFGAEN